MKLNQYKTYRSKNFPMGTTSSKSIKSSKPKNQQISISTYGICAVQNPKTYQMYALDKSEDNAQDKSQKVIMFNDHEFMERAFTKVFRLYSFFQNNLSLTNMENRRKEEYEQLNKTQRQDLLATIKESIVENPKNLFIFPVLDSQNYNELVFAKKVNTVLENTGTQSQNNESTPNKDQQSILKTIVETFVEKKRQKTILCISVLSLNADGSLVDQLDLQWLSEPTNIDISAKQKARLKVQKIKQDIKTFQLNRQQILSWNEAYEIISHYQQVSDYIEYWRTFEEPCRQCKNGQIYEISEVEIDPEFGSILKVINKTYFLAINQYHASSNLLMMKISQLLTNVVEKKGAQNVRDYPVTLFLSECFNHQHDYKINLFTQLGTVETLKEQCICLSMNLKIPGHYIYSKNYCDQPKLIKKIKPHAKIFTITDNRQKTIQPSYKARLGKQSVKLYEESAKVTAKSFSYETYSSFNKKRNNEVDQKFESTNREQQNASLVDVYGSNWRASQLKKNQENNRKTEMATRKERKKRDEDQSLE